MGERRDMTIELKPEQSHVIDRAIAAGLIKHVDEVMEAGVETLRNRLETEVEAARGGIPQRGSSAKARAFEKWARSHPHMPALPDEALRRESLVRTPE